jgi:peptide-methionine (S)-S-oxide reductase
MERIIFAGGCFWGVEAYFNRIKGVLHTRVGYANGKTENPTYDEVCSHKTGFTEACFIEYDNKVISLENLLEAFWKIIDPTLLNRQGHDIGDQYRTGVYYFDDFNIPIINKSKEAEQKKYPRPIVTEIEKVRNFYEAEEYHQKYLKKNPNGYCHIPEEFMKK